MKKLKYVALVLCFCVAVGDALSKPQQPTHIVCALEKLSEFKAPFLLDIKANGEDSHVWVDETENVVVTIDIIADNLAGKDHDVWILAKNAAGKKYSYGSDGKWHRGWNSAYYSGPLKDFHDTVLDRMLPLQDYVFYLGLDEIANGNLNIPFVVGYDLVNVHVIAAPPPPLYDNGDTDGGGALSMATVIPFGYRRTLLDDFVVPSGETWTITDFHCYYSPDDNISQGTDFELDFLFDAGGAPGGLIVTTTGHSYSEAATSRIWFGYIEKEASLEFDAVVLGPGTYWIEGTVVNPVNSFWWVRGTITGSPCWINYEDFGGLQPCSNLIGFDVDLSFKLTGTR